MVRSVKVLSCLALLVGIIHAQVTYQYYFSPEFGYEISYPDSWNVEQTPDGVEISLDTNTNFGIFVVPFNAEDMEFISQMSLDEVASLMIEGLQQELGGFHILQSRDTQVAGQPSKVIEFGAAHEETGVPMTGAMYVFLYANRLYALAYGAENASLPQHQPVFNAMLSSFNLEEGSLPPQPGEVGTPPAPPSANPLGGQTNPLAGPSTNPLAPSDPLVGIYSDGQLQLSLQGDNGFYTGEITFNNQMFPVTVGDVVSDGTSVHLFGSFQSGADQFAFSASWDGETIMFETGGASYTLRR
jgi:hypothetical protein